MEDAPEGAEPKAETSDPEKLRAEEKEKREKNLEELKKRTDDRVQFSCSVCGLCELTKFGKLEHKTASTLEEVFYIPDPFVPFDIHKTDFRPTDYVVFGAKCGLCKQSVCVSKNCSLFYQTTYCICCVQREQHAFPAEMINELQKRFSAKEEPVKPAPVPQETPSYGENE